MIATAPTHQQYADELVRLVLDDWDPGQLVAIGSWEGLHFVCDANEYLIDADSKFGIDYTGSDEQNEFVNDAITLAAKALGWEES